MKLFQYGLLVGIFLLLILPSKTFAASLTGAKDTITTSRPSPSSPLSANAASGDALVSIFNNGSRYLASDSAKLKRTSTVADVDPATIVASQSAALTTVYFGETLGAAGLAGIDVLFVPITAMHTIQFTTVNALPANSDIVLTFPTLTAGDSDDDASPSATTFQFNNLVSGTGGRDNIDVFDDSTDISANVTITETEPSSGAPGILLFNLDSGTIAGGSVVKIYLGCSASTSSSCSAQVPRIINPTKAAAAGTGDRWKINIQTEDNNDVALDTATVAVATIESVQVFATVDPTLTFTIAGISNGTAANNGNTTGCGNTETTNSGISATATVVNMGIVANTPTSIDTKVSNIAAQLLTVTTNGSGGYALTATSSGPLRNPGSGFDITSSTTPAVFPNGTPWFGIHPCGLDVTAATWSTGSDQSCNTYITGSTGDICKYGWPTQTTALSLASDTTGPIGNSIAAGNGLVSVEYAAGVDVTVPAGVYQSIVTYVATATF